jgi:hypothetical protein
LKEQRMDHARTSRFVILPIMLKLFTPTVGMH